MNKNCGIKATLHYITWQKQLVTLKKFGISNLCNNSCHGCLDCKLKTKASKIPANSGFSIIYFTLYLRCLSQFYTVALYSAISLFLHAQDMCM